MKGDSFWFLVIYMAIILLWLTVAKLDKHLQEWHEEWQAVSSQPVDTRPAIPNCLKPTWERITEGCDDEGHD